MSDMSERIEEVSAGILGVQTALMAARQRLGDKHVATFLDQVPEKGSDLWERFREFKAEKEDRPGNNLEVNFFHFIAAIVMPDAFN
ncbi:hypothetical protein HQ571_06740 [Candidatus Kuenenbacteria bacterium]|nr:hypothetical protein [Candidatus Kuenenbacteria bacterium]